jgi:hypothetical protein
MNTRKGGPTKAKADELRKKPNKASSGDAVVLDFDDAVREAREILARIEGEHRKDQMRLGELADEVQTTYGQRTLAKFAKKIGIASCTLNRYRSVYRAWDGEGIQAPGPVSYAVLRELQAHPGRAAIVEKNPTMSKREARELAQEDKHKGQAKKQKASDWEKADCKRYLAGIVELAREAIKAGDFTRELKDTRHLRAVIEPKLLPVIRDGGEALRKIADYLEQLGAEEEELAKVA